MIIEKLAKATKAEGLSNERRAEGFYLSPSGVGDCLRKQFYEAAGVLPDSDPRRVHILEDGRFHEDLTVKWFETVVPEVQISERQEPVNIAIPDDITLQNLITECPLCKNRGYSGIVPEDHLHGHIDGKIYVEGRRLLFEHKAVGDEAFRSFMRGKIPKAYLYQVGMYLCGSELEDACMFVKNKARSTYLEVLLKYDHDRDQLYVERITDFEGITNEVGLRYESIVREGFLRLKRLEQYLREGRTPPREVSYTCRGCPYKTVCHEQFALQRRPSDNRPVDLTTDSGRRQHTRLFNLLKEYGLLKKKAAEIGEEMEDLKPLILSEMARYNIKTAKMEGFEAVHVSYVSQQKEFDFDGFYREHLLHYTKEELIEIISKMDKDEITELFRMIPPEKLAKLLEVPENEVGAFCHVHTDFVDTLRLNWKTRSPRRTSEKAKTEETKVEETKPVVQASRRKR